jgi:hypothetical protein
MSDNRTKLQALWSKFLQELSNDSVIPGVMSDENARRLILIMRFVPPLRWQAWRRFLKPFHLTFQDALLTEESSTFAGSIEELQENSRPLPRHLLWVMEDVPELRREAWEELLSQYLEEPFRYSSDLIEVMKKFPELRPQAWELIRDQGCDLVCIIESFPELRQEAWSKLVKMPFDASSFQLVLVMKKVSELRQAAWEMVVVQGTRSTLISVMDMVPELRQEAWRKLSTMTIDRQMLCQIMEIFPEFYQEVQALLIKSDTIIRDMVEVSKE